MSKSPRVPRIKVDDLDAPGALAAARTNQQALRMAELNQLRLAGRWCVLHPATTDTGVATWDPDTSLGAQLMADALDLQHRLPELWARDEALAIPSWQARRVAQHTHALPLEGARWVDDRLTERITGWGSIVVDRVAKIRDWVGHAQVSVQRVLDLGPRRRSRCQCPHGADAGGGQPPSRHRTFHRQPA